MTLSRNAGALALAGGLAAALLLHRAASTEWAQFAPDWHRYIREGDATVVALLVALFGLYVILRTQR